jgi:hypothetical protein
MKRSAGALGLLLVVMSGCMSMGEPGAMPTQMGSGCFAGGPAIPGVQGPWGLPVPQMASARPTKPMSEGQAAALAAISQYGPQGVPPHLPPMPSGVMQAGGPPMPTGAVVRAGGPASAAGGVLPANYCCGQSSMAGGAFVPGVVAAQGALLGPSAGPFPTRRTEVRFVGPAGMKISWPTYGGPSQPLEAPARYNFLQAAIYRLKLSDIPNRPGLELYPTLEVVPSNHKTDPFLSHAAVPVMFTEEDFEQVASGTYVVKVIYLPDPQYQDLAVTGPDEVVSTRLEPGVDPIAEAQRRGSILVIIRMGNIDLEAPNTPPMNAPGVGGVGPGCAPPPGLIGGMPGPMGPGGAMLAGPMPPGMMGPGGPMPPPGMMGPGGPMGNPMMAGPGMPGMMPPGMPMPPGMMPSAVPTGNPMPRPMPNKPITQLPDKPEIQPASAARSVTSAQEAGDAAAVKSPPVEKKEPARRWWILWGSKSE